MVSRTVVLAAVALLAIAGCKNNTNDSVDFLARKVSAKNDSQLSLDYKDKPVVVYLWATWCGPCKQFAPTLNEFAAKYQPKGITFLAISNEKEKVIIESELREPHKMTVMSDPYGSAAEAIGSTALPTLVVLDKDHKPVYATQGISKDTVTELTAALDGLS